MKERYVYALLDPRKPGKYVYRKRSYNGKKGKILFKCDYEPFYIGKGSGGRAERHYESAYEDTLCYDSMKNRIIRKSIKQTNKCKFIIISYFRKDEPAFRLEKKLIKVVGRRELSTGPLANLSDGGEGIIGLDRNGKNNSFFGKKHSKETKAKMRESHIDFKPSNEHKEKISAGVKRRWKEKGYLSEESLKKRGMSRSKTWEVTTPRGNVLTIKNLSLFARKRNLHAGNLRSERNKFSSKGYTARRLSA